MIRTLLAALLLAGASLPGTPAPTTHAQSGQLPLLDGVGMHTLRDLGHADILLPAGGGILEEAIPNVAPHRYAAESVQYRLPDGASQGPDTWYVIHFHFEVVFADEGEGRVTVYALPNTWPAALINFEVSGQDESPAVTWGTVGLTEGRESGTADSRRVEMRFSNYLPDDSIVPGTNELKFSVREHDDAKVEMLRVFDDTAVQVTPLAPPKLELSGQSLRAPVDADEPLEVHFSVRNAGGWPAKDIVTEISYPEDSLQLIGEPSLTFPAIEGSESVSGRFLFKMVSPGPYEISLTAQGKTGGQTAAAVTTATTGEKPAPRVRYYGLYVLVVALSLLPFVPYRRLLAPLRGSFAGPEHAGNSGTPPSGRTAIRRVLQKWTGRRGGNAKP